MGFIFANGRHRWFVGFSSIFMMIFAVLAGFGRMFAERVNQDWGPYVGLPGELWALVAQGRIGDYI